MLVFMFAGIFALSSCSKTSNNNPASPGGGDTLSYFPGEFGFTLNGSSYDRKTAKFQWSSSAQITPNAGTGVPANGKMLSINLIVTIDSANGSHQTLIQFYIPFTNAPVLGTFTIPNVADYVNPSVRLTIAAKHYDAKPGGTVTITSFDTVNNYVTATFSLQFVAELYPGDTLAPTTGYFYQVPIYQGSYGQGVVTADIDGYKFSSAGGGNNFSFAFGNYNGIGMDIQAVSYDSTSGTREFLFIVPVLATGDYPLSNNAYQYGQYIHSVGVSSEIINGQGGAIGRITITSIDTVKQRFSGTFSLSGVDQNSGKTINVTNGVMTNVLYFHI
ncbi:MAG TPA: DUF6252 family protein [Candidatus Kapabacteria bacterium]|nr:DUF6252 family protein [Candidatus Kapabacteria bacterium]